MAEQSENDLYPKDDESIIAKSMKSLKKSQKIHQHALEEMEKMEGAYLPLISTEKNFISEFIFNSIYFLLQIWNFF